MWLGNVRPNACTRSFSSSGAARGSGASFNALSASACAVSGSSVRSSGAARRSNSAITVRAPETHGPSAPERQRLDPAHRRQRQRTIEMRKQCAAARGLVAQRRARAPPHRPPPARRSALPAKCRAAVSATCAGGGKVDVAVGKIDRRAGETPARSASRHSARRKSCRWLPARGPRLRRADPYRALSHTFKRASAGIWTNPVFIPT